MIDKDLVRRKLARLNMYLDQLAPIAAKTFDEYMDIDDRKVYEAITREKVDFNEYIKQVDGYLDTLEPRST